MKRRMWVGMALLACGGGQQAGVPVTVAKAEYFGAGSRLVPRVASAGGGGDFLLGWFDLEHQAPCSFQRSSDGLLRCLPESQGLIRFEDPACSVALGMPPLHCAGLAAELEPPRFFLQPRDCGVEVYRATSSRPRPAAERSGYFIGYEGCRLEEEVAIGPESLPLEIVAAADFVAAHEAPGDAELSPGVKPWRLTADDGAWETRGFFDTENQWPCAIASPDEQVSTRCLPLPSQQVFGDATSCVWPGVTVVACDDAPTFVFSAEEAPNGACLGPGLRLYEAQPYVLRPECGESIGNLVARTTQQYEPGAELSLDTLPSIERMHVGTERLRLQFQGHHTVPYFPDRNDWGPVPSPLPAVFLDTRFDELCYLQPIGRDRYLCLSQAWEEAEQVLELDGYAACLSQPLATRPRPDPSRPECEAPYPSLRGFWSHPSTPVERDCSGPSAGQHELREARAFDGEVVYSPVDPEDPASPPQCDSHERREGEDYFMPGSRLDPALVVEIQVRTLLP